MNILSEINIMDDDENDLLLPIKMEVEPDLPNIQLKPVIKVAFSTFKIRFKCILFISLT